MPGTQDHYHTMQFLTCAAYLPFSDAIALEAPQGAPYVIVVIPPNTSVTPVTQNHYYSISTVQYLTMPQKMMRYPADLQYLPGVIIDTIDPFVVGFNCVEHLQ